MNPLQVKLLGEPAVLLHGEKQKAKTWKLMALLAYLTLEKGVQRRDQLAGLLWPDHEVEAGRASLRTHLGWLRQLLGDSAPALQADRETVNLHLLPETVDALWLLECRKGPEDLLLSNASMLMGLKPTLLEGMEAPDLEVFSEWLELRRQECRQVLLSLLEQVGILLEAQGQPEKALDLLHQAFLLEPTSETLARKVMAVQAALQDSTGVKLTLQTLQGQLALMGESPSLPTQQTFRELAESRTPPLKRASLLVGREKEHRVLVEAFRKVQQGQPLAVGVEGEPGIGKTHLMQGFLKWVRSQGAQVLTARGWDTEGQLPHHLLRELLSGQPPARLPATVQVLLGHPTSEAPSDPGAFRVQLMDDLSQLLEKWAAEKPLLLFLDDLQWTDSSSLEVLQYLLEHLSQSGEGVLVLWTQRSGERGSPAVQRFTTRLHRILRVQRLKLDLLGRGDVESWLSDLIGNPPHTADLLQWCWKRTHGHPLYLQETLRSLMDTGVLLQVDGHWRVRMDQLPPSLPTSVLAAIEERLLSLSENALRVLQACTVLAANATLSHLGSVACLAEMDTLDALDQALQAEVILEKADHYTFSHDCIQEVVDRGLSRTRLRVLHSRAVGTLVQMGAHPSTLAHHAGQAGQGQQAMDFHLQAAREVARLGDLIQAIWHGEEALQAYQQLGERFMRQVPTEQVYGLFDLLDTFHNRFDDQSERRRILLGEMLKEGRERQDVRLICRALTERSGLEVWTAGEEHHALPTLQEARQVMGETPGDELWCWWHNAHFFVAHRFNDNALCLRHAALALEHAQKLGDPLLISVALANVAVARGAENDYARMAEAVEASSRTFEQLQDHAETAKAQVTAAYVYLMSGQLERGVQVAREALTLSRKLQAEQLEVSALRPLVSGLIQLGNLGDLPLHLDRFAELLERRSNPGFRALCLLDLGSAWHVLGDAHKARQCYLQAETLHQQSHMPHFQEHLQPLLCLLSMQEGRCEEGLPYALHALERRNGSASAWMISTVHEEVQALLKGNPVSKARTLVDLHQTPSEPRQRWLGHLALAAWQDHHGDTAQALEHLTLALQATESQGLALEAWRCRVKMSLLDRSLQSEVQQEFQRLSVGLEPREKQQVVALFTRDTGLP